MVSTSRIVELYDMRDTAPRREQVKAFALIGALSFVAMFVITAASWVYLGYHMSLLTASVPGVMPYFVIDNISRRSAWVSKNKSAIGTGWFIGISLGLALFALIYCR